MEIERTDSRAEQQQQILREAKQNPPESTQANTTAASGDELVLPPELTMGAIVCRWRNNPGYQKQCVLSVDELLSQTVTICEKIHPTYPWQSSWLNNSGKQIVSRIFQAVHDHPQEKMIRLVHSCCNCSGTKCAFDHFSEALLFVMEKNVTVL